jgi:prevent-host-death family protein
MQANVHEAKSQLSKLLEAAERGEEVVIARAGEPVAKLVAIRRNRSRETLGAYQGAIEIGADFDEPLPEFDETFGG